jgi:hypothetical protein
MCVSLYSVLGESSSSTAPPPPVIHFCSEVLQKMRVLVCTDTGWTTEKSVFDSRQGQEIFLFSTASRPALGPNR